MCIILFLVDKHALRVQYGTKERLEMKFEMVRLLNNNPWDCIILYRTVDIFSYLFSVQRSGIFICLFIFLDFQNYLCLPVSSFIRPLPKFLAMSKFL